MSALSDETQEHEWSLDEFMADMDRVQANPPPAPPGLELVECDSEPRHWPTYFAHVDGMYPGAPCPACVYDDQRQTIERLRHKAEHHRWQTWRIIGRFSRWAYPMGVISGSGTSYNSCPECPIRYSLYWRGKRSYFLGKPRPWWECLRRGHRYRPLEGRTFALCAVCLPCPDCGSADPDHYVCGGAP